MLPGPTLVKACPHCSALVLVPTLTSGNTFGAIRYSDGKTVAPMLPDVPHFHLCRSCGQPFWLQDAVDHGRAEEFPDNLPSDLESARCPTAVEHLQALQMGLAQRPQDERSLLTGWWWAVNDAQRALRPGQVVPQHPEDWEANLARLADLLDREDPSDRLCLGEIARQQGRFEEAIDLLSEPVPDELQPVAQALLALAEKRSQSVEVLPNPV